MWPMLDQFLSAWSGADSMLINSAPRDQYVCLACEVYGQGDECWLCGSREVDRSQRRHPAIVNASRANSYEGDGDGQEDQG